MNKKWILTISGILVSCVFTFTGFWGMQELLVQKQEKVLSQTGMVPAIAVDWQGTDSSSKTELSKEELAQILRNLESTAEEEPHEPFGNQLTMKKAIEKGKEWMKDFYKNYIGIGYEEFETYEKVTAVLCEKKRHTADDTIADGLYSYWTVEYIVKDIEVELVLNSVTGQVLRVKVTSYIPDKDFLSLNVEKLFRRYAEAFLLDTDSAVKKEGNTIYVSAEDSSIYIVLRTDSIKISQVDKTGETREISNTLELLLSTKIK